MTRAVTIAWPGRQVRLLGLLLSLAGPLAAQTQPVTPVQLPDLRDLSAALAEPASRPDAMLTVIAVWRLLERTPQSAEDAASLAAAFSEDRAWLDRLAARYAYLPSRSTILDPAAWFIQQELGQHQIHPPHEVSPLGPDFESLTAQMFERPDDRLAAAFLPEVLFMAEVQAAAIWLRFLERAAASEPVAQAAAALHDDWFDPWYAAEPPAPEHSRQEAAPLEFALERLRVMMYAATLPGPPDALRAKRLRFGLYETLPELEPAGLRSAAQVLRLAAAVEGLSAGRLLEFTQSLLWVVTDLLDVHTHDADTDSPLPELIADFLPRLSGAMSRQFNDVDPRLNANVAAAFDVAQELSGGELRADRLARLQQELADSVAQMTLLAPDLAFYFDQPVRRRISEEIDICISVVAARDDEGRPMLARQQFDGCVDSMVSMVDSELRSAELAGDGSGPYGTEQLRRELDLMPWQRINYLLGFLHELAPMACAVPEQPLPNPLDWAVLASLLTWFGAETPVFLRTPENESRLERMEQQGASLVRVLSRQVDCISGSGAGVNDPVSEALAQYRESLEELVRGIRNAELAFRQQRLRPGADVVLGGDVDQRTAYRRPDLAIGPCDPERICEMTQTLDATRALIGLFPDEYLIADQTGLGSVEICYDDMQWVERRAEPVRAEDPNVANYFGRLSFELLGRYREGGAVETVFGARLVSPEEYHYLIAASDPAVLVDGCPVEWVGSRIVTSRGGDAAFPLVPDRLTYLAAARSRPSEVLLANWSRGDEWRDWFVTGIGVRPLDFGPEDGLRDRLGAHLRTLYQAEQQAVYGALLRPAARSRGEDDVALHDLLVDVTTYKTLVRALLLLLYPEALLDSDEIRAMVEGHNGLLDESVIRRFRSAGVPVGAIHDAGVARAQHFQGIWSEQPKPVVRSGSVAISVAHAMARLKRLNRTHFAPPPAAEPAETGGSGPAAATAD